MFYKDANNYWELVNGQFVFDDQYPFTQDKIFFNSDELFNFIGKKNFDINEWWNNKKTIQAKKSFCNKYCKKSDKPLNELLSII